MCATVSERSYILETIIFSSVISRIVQRFPDAVAGLATAGDGHPVRAEGRIGSGHSS